MADVRALSSAHRAMQRLGYLKRLVRRVVALSTSSVDNLGHDLIETVTRKLPVPLTSERAAYVRQRLSDRIYNGLKRQVAGWQEGEDLSVALELQDLYLADPAMPSQTGKLVRADSRHYPPLSVALGLVRAGTYSPNTRALSLLHLTPDDELQAFLEYRPEANPLALSRAQALLLLYAFLENDGEVIAPLLCQLASESRDGFDEREAGNRLPRILRGLIVRHQRRMLTAEERERLEMLSKVADSVESWRGRPYTGASSREHNARVRLEPYVDIGLLAKPDPSRYGYRVSTAGQVWAQALCSVETDEQVALFLSNGFVATAAQALGIAAQPVSEQVTIVPHLRRAWSAIQSGGGYAPIEEMALVAGIHALLDHGLIIEQASAREAILAYQRANPYEVRFTVNRMGVLAHARFLEPPAESTTPPS